MFKEVIEKIKKAEKIAVFNHINPDGDAHGSAFGLKLALLEMGKVAEVFLREGDDKTTEYRLLKGTQTQGLKIEDCDLKIAVDCADAGRLGIFAESFVGNTVAIDHHVTHKQFAKSTVVAPSAPATGEIVFDLISEMGINITADIAHNLYMAIVCDTGSFKFSSTTPKTHLVAAELMKTGIDIAELSKKLFDTKSFEYLKLYKKGIERLELYCAGKIALLCFCDEDFLEAGISEADADAVVTLPSSIAGTEVGVYIRQRNDGFKVSLRSNGMVNVADIAEKFGGGGHERASGFSMNNPIDEIKKVVTDEVAKSIKAAKSEK